MADLSPFCCELQRPRPSRKRSGCRSTLTNPRQQIWPGLPQREVRHDPPLRSARGEATTTAARLQVPDLDLPRRSAQAAPSAATIGDRQALAIGGGQMKKPKAYPAGATDSDIQWVRFRMSCYLDLRNHVNAFHRALFGKNLDDDDDDGHKVPTTRPLELV